jgi:hypothetical protein
MLPPCPDEELPEPINIEPLLPLLEVPVLKITEPLTPSSPALDVRIDIIPLDVDDPYPLVIYWLPPDNADESPADITISPPIPLSPDPTVS